MLQRVLLRDVVGFVIKREADGAPSSCTEFCSELGLVCVMPSMGRVGCPHDRTSFLSFPHSTADLLT